MSTNKPRFRAMACKCPCCARRKRRVAKVRGAALFLFWCAFWGVPAFYALAWGLSVAPTLQ